MQIVVLTVRTAGDTKKHPQYTLELDNERKSLTRTCSNLSIVLGNELIQIEDALLTYQRNGRITNTRVNEWIIDHELNKTLKGKPAKLVFTLSIKDNVHSYIFYPFQANLMKFK